MAGKIHRSRYEWPIRFTAMCSACRATVSIETYPRRKAIAAFREAGWTISKRRNWHCPKCPCVDHTKR